MRLPFRTRVHACVHPETYRYYLPPEALGGIWQECARWLGMIRRNPVLPIKEIDGAHMLLRAPEAGSPITVIRKRTCTVEDIDRLHKIFGIEVKEAN